MSSTIHRDNCQGKKAKKEEDGWGSIWWMAGHPKDIPSRLDLCIKCNRAIGNLVNKFFRKDETKAK